jgi:hypothetical protein
MATKANALKDVEYKKTAIMRANAMRKKVELRYRKELDKAPAYDDDEGIRTLGVRGTTSRIGTPMLGGTPNLRAPGFLEDVERAQSSRNGSQVRLMT